MEDHAIKSLQCSSSIAHILYEGEPPFTPLGEGRINSYYLIYFPRHTLTSTTSNPL